MNGPVGLLLAIAPLVVLTLVVGVIIVALARIARAAESIEELLREVVRRQVPPAGG